MTCVRPRTTFPALAVVVSLLTAACIGSGSADDDAADVGTTRMTETDGADDAESTTSMTVNVTTASAVPDLTDMAWVVNDFDGLLDDRGRTIAPPATGIHDDRRPSVIRSVDGLIYYVLDGRLWRRTVDSSEPEEIDTEADEIFGVSHDSSGNIIVNPHDDPEVVADGAAVGWSDTIPGEAGELITASNGITVRILPPDADVDDRGYVTEFRSPARLEVERDGVVEWTVDAGGVRAPWLGLVDFDGRFVMMARYPTEPADPMIQHIVYDLDCPSGDAAGQGCTRTFWARWGTAALVGPDRGPGDDDLNTVGLDICPTMGALIDPPAEMTNPASFDEDFTDDDLEAFRLAALQLTTCDPYGLGDPEQPGLLYIPEVTIRRRRVDVAEFARSLRGPFARARGHLVWSQTKTVLSAFWTEASPRLTSTSSPGGVTPMIWP